jgi:hypothetical protein
VAISFSLSKAPLLCLGAQEAIRQYWDLKTKNKKTPVMMGVTVLHVL